MRLISKKVLFVFSAGAFLLSCTTSSVVKNYDYTYLYDEEQKIINPSFKLFHSSKDSSSLYFQLESEDILYSRLNDSDAVAKVWVKYHLKDSRGANLLDSATIPLINFGSNTNDFLLQSSIKFKVGMGDEYQLEVRFRDENKDLNVVYNLAIDKRLNLNEQFFLLQSNGAVVFNEIVSSGVNLELIKSPIIEEDKFILAHSPSKYKMTPPPFIEATDQSIQFKSSSQEELDFQGKDKIDIYNLSTSNFLRTIDDSIMRGYFFYYFHEGFPEITKLDQLQEPIRYISTSSEYRGVKAAVNEKKAIDAFWLKLGKEEEKSKAMIKEYYGRVEKSNKYFSSYKEGWKTDRGIIFIIYGQPTTIYKTAFKETWIYGEENNILSLKFDFFKNEKGIFNNDYQLMRSPEYKNAWYRAVDLWRQGKIQ